MRMCVITSEDAKCCREGRVGSAWTYAVRAHNAIVRDSNRVQFKSIQLVRR